MKTTYNRSEIFTAAHQIRRGENVSMSAALRKAWALAKIENINSEAFMLAMKDLWNASDYEYDRKLSRERSRIAGAAGIKIPAGPFGCEPVKTAPVVAPAYDDFGYTVMWNGKIMFNSDAAADKYYAQQNKVSA